MGQPYYVCAFNGHTTPGRLNLSGPPLVVRPSVLCMRTDRRRAVSQSAGTSLARRRLVAILSRHWMASFGHLGLTHAANPTYNPQNVVRKVNLQNAALSFIDRIINLPTLSPYTIHSRLSARPAAPLGFISLGCDSERAR